MVGWIGTVRGLCGLAAIGLLVAACGGQSHDGCTQNGVEYAVGASVPSPNCNACSCVGPGQITCTLGDCMTCDTVAADWSARMLEAKRCTPGLDFQCVTVVGDGLTCGCETFVTDAGPLDSPHYQWARLECDEGTVCGACPPPPLHGECATEGVNEGFCVDVYEDPPEPGPNGD